MRKKLIGVVLAAVMAASAVGGCASANVDNKERVADSKADTVENSGSTGQDKMELVLWTGLAGQPGEVIQKVVDDYNGSQDKVFVELQYQGSYQESLNKLKTTMRIWDSPLLQSDLVF